MTSPSDLLQAAADRIRDLAAAATKPRPNGHGWSVLSEDDGWVPGTPTVVSCAGYGGEDLVAADVAVEDGRWIAALSPAVAPELERWMRETSKHVRVHGANPDYCWICGPALEFAARVCPELVEEDQK